MSKMIVIQADNGDYTVAPYDDKNMIQLLKFVIEFNDHDTILDDEDEAKALLKEIENPKIIASYAVEGFPTVADKIKDYLGGTCSMVSYRIQFVKPADLKGPYNPID